MILHNSLFLNAPATYTCIYIYIYIYKNCGTSNRTSFLTSLRSLCSHDSAIIVIFEWAKYIPMLANIQIHKNLTFAPSTNNNLEVLRTLMRQNIPTLNSGNLHMQCLPIPKLNHVGQAQGHLNGSHTIQACANVSSVWCVAPCSIVSVLEKAPIALHICALCTSLKSIPTISMHKRRRHLIHSEH